MFENKKKKMQLMRKTPKSDLTGEIMRNAINSLGHGNMDVYVTLLEILQTPEHAGWLHQSMKHQRTLIRRCCSHSSRAACRWRMLAMPSVRGSEIPKGHLEDSFSQRGDEWNI